MWLSSVHEIGADSGRRCAAHPPVYMRDKQRYIERSVLPQRCTLVGTLITVLTV
jgi:hypothetical protein